MSDVRDSLKAAWDKAFRRWSLPGHPLDHDSPPVGPGFVTTKRKPDAEGRYWRGPIEVNKDGTAIGYMETHRVPGTRREYVFGKPLTPIELLDLELQRAGWRHELAIAAALVERDLAEKVERNLEGKWLW